ncbi:MAG TPA: hypothetical protein VHM91_14075 [Verrucomicrobiales bacterium]|jgi:hypothetical protein|nr:hypothetical protein [Verrucomicrobiales bacterium]
MPGVFEVLNYVDGFEPSKLMVHIGDREITHPDVVFVVEEGLLKRIEVEVCCFQPYLSAGKAQMRIHYAGSLRLAETVPLDPRRLQLITAPDNNQSPADDRRGNASVRSAPRC